MPAKRATAAIAQSPAAPEPEGWSITLDGREYALVPSHEALAAVERCCGRPLYTIVSAATSDGLTIEDMASIAASLVPATETDPLFARAAIAAREGMIRALGAPIRAAILDAGVMRCTAHLLLPLASALMGKTTADGARKPEA
jgi:hypothetical protein